MSNTSRRARGIAIAFLAGVVLSVASARAGEDALRAAVLGAVREALGEAVAASPDLGGAAGLACAGDCNADGRVSVDELIRAVSIALGLTPLGECAGLDTNLSARVEVQEIIAAVGHALDGCGGSGGESVCGGPITSAPRICDLTITPRITTAFGTLRISFGLSDLEGDLVEICGALVPQGTPLPELSCDALPPDDQTINGVLEVPPIQLSGARNGTYVLYLQVRDSTGARSEIVSAAFTVGVRA